MTTDKELQEAAIAHANSVDIYLDPQIEVLYAYKAGAEWERARLQAEIANKEQILSGLIEEVKRLQV